MGRGLRQFFLIALIAVFSFSFCMSPAYCKPGKDKKEKKTEKKEKSNKSNKNKKDKKQKSDESRLLQDENSASSGVKTKGKSTSQYSSAEMDAAVGNALNRLASAQEEAGMESPNKPSLPRDKASSQTAPSQDDR